MSKEKNPTVDEHVIPQVYLRGFSPDKANIYFYDLAKDEYSKKLVTIKSQEYVKNVYEFRDLNGELLAVNTIENIFAGIYEKLFKINRQKLLSRAVLDENLKTKSFLPKDEKYIWIVLAAIQFCRHPKYLDLLISLIKEEGITNSDIIARNTALLCALPTEVQLELDKVPLLKYEIELLSHMGMMFGRCNKVGKIFTSDFPIIGEMKDGKLIKFVYPITEDICLYFFAYSECKPGKRNVLFDLTYEDYKQLIKAIVYAADNKLYMSEKMSDKVYAWVREAYQEKKEESRHV